MKAKKAVELNLDDYVITIDETEARQLLADLKTIFEPAEAIRVVLPHVKPHDYKLSKSIQGDMEEPVETDSVTTTGSTKDEKVRQLDEKATVSWEAATATSRDYIIMSVEEWDKLHGLAGKPTS